MTGLPTFTATGVCIKTAKVLGRSFSLKALLHVGPRDSITSSHSSNSGTNNHPQVHDSIHAMRIWGQGSASPTGPEPHLDGGQRLAGLGAALPEDAAGGAALALVAEAHAALLGLLDDDQVRPRPGARGRGPEPAQGAAPGRRRGPGRGGAQGDGAQGGCPARHQARQPLSRARRRHLQAEAVLLNVLIDDLCERNKTGYKKKRLDGPQIRAFPASPNSFISVGRMPGHKAKIHKSPCCPRQQPPCHPQRPHSQFLKPETGARGRGGQSGQSVFSFPLHLHVHSLPKNTTTHHVLKLGGCTSVLVAHDPTSASPMHELLPLPQFSPLPLPPGPCSIGTTTPVHPVCPPHTAREISCYSLSEASSASISLKVKVNTSPHKTFTKPHSPQKSKTKTKTHTSDAGIENWALLH